MSGTNSTATTASGVPISSLPAANAVSENDGVFGVFGGEAKLADPKTLVAAGLPDNVVKTDDLDAALSDSSLSQYAEQAAQHAADAKTGAAQSQTGAASSAASAGQAAQTGVQVAAIAENAKTNNDAAQQAVAGVTADANAAKVMLTAAMGGDAPLNYRGYWNASTNTPALASGSGSDGDLYIVSVAGTTALDGNSTWAVGDGAWYTNGQWVYFARAGWAAVARSITSLSTIIAGQASVASAPAGWAAIFTDAVNSLRAAISASGEYFGGDPVNPTFGLTESGVAAGALRVMPSSDGSMAIVDENNIALVVIDASGKPNFGGLMLGAMQTGVVTTDQNGVVHRPQETVTPTNLVLRPETLGRCDQRGPTGYDDASQGYAVGDLWSRNGLLSSVTYMAPNGAVWEPQSFAVPLPGDVFGADLAGAWGATPMIAGYTGPALDIATVTGGVIATTTVAILPNGQLDMASVGKAMAQADAGTYAYAVRVYDQTGGGNHLTVPTYVSPLTVDALANAPVVGYRQIGGKPCITFSADDLTKPQALAIPSSLSVSAGAFCWALIGATHATNGDMVSHAGIGQIGSGTSVTRFDLGAFAESGLLSFCDVNWANHVQSKTMLSADPGFLAISGAGSDTLSVASLHEGVDSVAMATGFSSGTLSGGTVGAPWDGTNTRLTVPVRMLGLVLARRAATTADVDNLRRSCSVYYDSVPQVRDRIYTLGDSLTAGFEMHNGFNWPDMIRNYLANPVQIKNPAVTGSYMTQFIAYTLPNVISDIRASNCRNHIVLWYGVNDLGANQNPAQIIANMQTIINALRAENVEKIILIGQYNWALNNAYRTAVQTGTLKVDGFIDLFQEKPFTLQGQAPIFLDHNHMAAGAQIAWLSRAANLVNHVIWGV